MVELHYVHDWQHPKYYTQNTGFLDRNNAPIMLNQLVWVEGRGVQMVRNYDCEPDKYCCCCPNFQQISHRLEYIKQDDIVGTEFYVQTM